MTDYNVCINRYWSLIDEVIREAVVLRGIRVRLLISFWKKTHPLTINFVTSLKSLCMQLHNCSLEVVRELTIIPPNMFYESCSLLFAVNFWTFFLIHYATITLRMGVVSLHTDFVESHFLQRFFSHKEQKDDIQHGLNHNKYMVTDNALYIGRQCIMCFQPIPFKINFSIVFAFTNTFSEGFDFKLHSS